MSRRDFVTDYFRFALWALTFRGIPSTRQVVKEWGIDQETATRWIAKWKPIRAEIEAGK